jgi:NADH dehydrogenase
VQQQQVIFLAHARDHGYTYQPGELKGLDRARRRVQLAEIRSPDGELLLDARELEYDVLILALGSQANDFGVPGVREHCYFIDSQQQAETFNEALRMRVFRSIARDEPFRVAIVGAGATGVELAAELSRLLEIAQAYGDETVRERLQLTLLESGPRILAAFPPRISASAQRRLEQIGIHVLTSTRVTSADANGFHYGDGSFAEADLMVWAAGVKASDFMQALGGLDTNRANQIMVGPTLQATADEHVFAIGDCASLQPDGQQRPLPPTAQVATQQAEHLAKHLPAWLDGKPLPPFAFHDFGALVSISDYDAFGTLGQFGFFRGGFIQGRFAQFSHLMLYRRHQQALHGFSKATLLWIAERINGCVQPRIRLS